MLLLQLNACVLDFEHLKVIYEQDEEFGKIYEERRRHPKGDFLIQDRYLFKGARLCIPKYKTREFLVREVHGGSLASHYGENKTSIVLKEHY